MDVDRGVARDTEDARERVQVLVERELEHGRTALAIGRTFPQSVHTYNGLRTTEQDAPGDDRRVGKEEDPDTVPALAVRLNDLLLVTDPVQVPPPERR